MIEIPVSFILTVFGWFIGFVLLGVFGYIAWYSIKEAKKGRDERDALLFIFAIGAGMVFIISLIMLSTAKVIVFV